jgi:catenin alpha
LVKIKCHPLTSISTNLVVTFLFVLSLQLDSVTSLIQAAKNLMNAVVQTVKMSYIASTKIIRIQSSAGPRHPVVMWRMKAPAKKPLIKREKPEETWAAVRRGSAKKKIHPVQVMSEFRGRQVY